jgi:protein subunit release factor A
MLNEKEQLVYRLRKRAEIRRSISERKSVQENKPDRISELLEEAADEIEKLTSISAELEETVKRLLLREDANDH